MQHKKIIVVGGGFGGFYTLKHLLKLGYEVTLISQTDHFTFIPLLRAVAIGNLKLSNIVFNYYQIIHSKKFEFIKSEVTQVDPHNNIVVARSGKYTYDYLVLATGSLPGNKLIGSNNHIFYLRNPQDAQAIKSFLAKLIKPRKKSFIISIIGGGPAGIETCLDMKDLIKDIKKKHSLSEFQFHIFHANQHILDALPYSMVSYATDILEQENISITLNSRITYVDNNIITTSHGDFKSDMIIQTTGSQANTSFINNSYKDNQHNLIVNKYLQLPQHKNIFALGDIICMENIKIPKLAQTAVMQAKVVAYNVHYYSIQRPLAAYKLKLRGLMLSLGGTRGIGLFKGFLIKGFPVWIAMHGAYFLSIPGVLNKFKLTAYWLRNLILRRTIPKK